MQGEDAERWKQICAQVVSEQDGQKLLELVEELNRLLDKKFERLKEQPEQGTGKEAGSS